MRDGSDRATLQALAAFDVGVIYYYLLEPHRYQSLVELLGHLPSSLPQSWRTAINLVCGSGVLFVSTILFFVNGKDLLHKGDFQPELLVDTNLIPQTLRKMGSCFSRTLID